jgi:phosphotransferase system  glucose/maltose/N-acetylglucosamine-specific IIC component
MVNRFKILFVFLAAALIMWIEMFVLRHYNFWIEMMFAAGLLAILSFIINQKEGNNKRLYYFEPHYIFIGIITAVLLYIILCRRLGI